MRSFAPCKRLDRSLRSPSGGSAQHTSIPFWEALCLAQIFGLTIASVGTLWVVPLPYAVAVHDLKVMS